MSRKKPPAFSLRKPSTAAVEAFVAGDATKPASKPRRPSVQAPKRQAKAREERERTTVYFSAEVRKRLAVYCAEHRAEMSQVVDEAVSKFLGRS